MVVDSSERNIESFSDRIPPVISIGCWDGEGAGRSTKVVSF